MPADERCRWTDISLLLDGVLARRYRDLPCDKRRDLEARVWRLSQPLLMLSDSAGNDRRTEHFARVTMARLAEHAATPYGVPWGDDLREITLRYGWPTWWSQDERDPMRATFDISVTGHDHPAMHFLPSIDTGVAWSPNVRRPRETYAPVYLKSIGPLDYQRARFRREDACLLVAAFDPRRDTLLSIGPIDLALAIAPDSSSRMAAKAFSIPGSTSWITASAGCGSLTASIEAYAPGRHHAARARFTVPALASDREPPPGHLAISDLLLLDAASARADSLPGDLAAALSLVRGSTTVVATGALGLYWELYGLDPGGERVTTALTVSPQHVGWLRRMTASLGVAGLPTPVRIEWTEVAGRTPRAGRAIAVNLAGIGSGDYEIEIRARTARSEAVARRRVHIVR